jgi:alpha-mannosidase
MSSPFTTLYLIPHAHTDFGYTHDPLITWELHDHFLDRAISLCEATSHANPHEQFHWTIEVFATLEHWWARRDSTAKTRLLSLMQSGRIDLGWRYVNGNFLNNPLNIRWEVARAAAFIREHGLPCSAAIQNDVNGFSLRYARELAANGVKGLAMGLNTTMGVTPMARPGAFWWQLGSDRKLLVWNGWIYNRIGRWVHLHELEQGLEAVWPDCVDRLPKDYPFSFAMMSGTIGDNVGPFERLPEQVAAFNAKKCGLEVRLTTFTGFLDVVASSGKLPVYQGDWNDAWPFGNGSMPHELTMLRRSQRRLEFIDSAQSQLGKHSEVDALTDRAQFEVSIACEHTYESHTSEGDHTLSNDGKRQWVECQAHFAHAESLSSLALRKYLFDHAAKLKVEVPSVLFVNPTDHELPVRILWNGKLATHITTSGVLEHLTQFDREPTIEGLERNPDIGVESAIIQPRSTVILPLKKIAGACEIVEQCSPNIENRALSLSISTSGNVTSAGKSLDPAANWINPDAQWKFGLPVIERPDPETPLKYKSEAEKRDPSDAEWNPDLRFIRQHSGRATRVFSRKNDFWKEAVVELQDSPVKNVAYRVDSLDPDCLEMTAEIRLDDSTDVKAFYLPMPFNLGEGGPSEFYYDSCGEWTRSVTDQLPGSSTSFYQCYRGVAVTNKTRCAYVIAPDAPMWQFGGFTFGHPNATIDQTSGTIISWLYNNYWYTNFPSIAPGWYRLKYLISVRDGGFDPSVADALYARFKVPFLHHPIWPKNR